MLEIVDGDARMIDNIGLLVSPCDIAGQSLVVRSEGETALHLGDLIQL